MVTDDEPISTPAVAFTAHPINPFATDELTNMESKIGRISAAITYVCTDGDNSFWYMSEPGRKELLESAKNILDTCVKDKIHLRIDPEHFRRNKELALDGHYLWCDGRKDDLGTVFESYMEANPGLFSRKFSYEQLSKIFCDYALNRGIYYKISPNAYGPKGLHTMFDPYMEEHPELYSRKLNDADLAALYSYVDTLREQINDGTFLKLDNAYWRDIIRK